MPRCPGQDTPHTAHVLIKHSSSGYQPPPSTISPINAVSSRPPANFLGPPDVITAALDHRLHFWAWDNNTHNPATSATSDSGLSAALGSLPGSTRVVSGGAQHYCSHPSYGHAATVDVLIDVPARGTGFG